VSSYLGFLGTNPDSPRGIVGLQGVHPLSPYGGLPESKYETEPAGDLEQTDLPDLVTGAAAAGRGESYTPLPGVLPTKDHLDYLQKFSAAGLLAIAFLLLIGIAVIRPRAAASLLGRAAGRQAGVI
jgi:hypothetical protein